MTSPSISSDMAASLIDHDVDLSDERAVIIHLNAAGFRARQINEHIEDAIDRARVMLANSDTLLIF